MSVTDVSEGICVIDGRVYAAGNIVGEINRTYNFQACHQTALLPTTSSFRLKPGLSGLGEDNCKTSRETLSVGICCALY